MSGSVKKVYSYTDEDRDQIRKKFGRNSETVISDVSIVQDWINKQAHLPQEIDEDFLERILLRNKFQIERAKKKLDFYYASRGIYADYLSRGDPSGIDITNVATSIQLSPIPKLTPDKERITVINFTENDRFATLEMGALLIFLILEVQQKFDYSSGDRVVVDLKNFNWQHYKTLTPSACARAATLFLEAYSVRIAGIEVLNAPTFFYLVMEIVKRYIKGKLLSKVTVHENLDSLYKCAPKQYLPREYGGEMPPMQKLYENAFQMLLANRDFILKALRNKSNEELRIGDIKYNDFFGIDGTFRKLEVD